MVESLEVVADLSDPELQAMINPMKGIVEIKWNLFIIKYLRVIK